MLAIIEDENSIVHIGEKTINGFISDDECTTCNSKIIFSEDFDALFCPQCNRWLESKCADKNCDYCKNRPIKPL
jgi:hypothetical protein